jgi:hypothetical protein
LGGRARLVGAMQRPTCVGPSIALMIVVKRLGGGGHVQQALVSFSLGNSPLCPETKSTHTHTHTKAHVTLMSAGY